MFKRGICNPNKSTLMRAMSPWRHGGVEMYSGKLWGISSHLPDFSQFPKTQANRRTGASNVAPQLQKMVPLKFISAEMLMESEIFLIE